MHEYSSKNINFRDFARAARDQNLRRASGPLNPDPRTGHPAFEQARRAGRPAFEHTN